MATGAMGRIAFSAKKRTVLFARRLRAAAIVVLLGAIMVAAGHLPGARDIGVRAADIGTAPASMSDFDYFPSHFAPPKGEPADQIATF